MGPNGASTGRGLETRGGSATFGVDVLPEQGGLFIAFIKFPQSGPQKVRDGRWNSEGSLGLGVYKEPLRNCRTSQQEIKHFIFVIKHK